MCVHSLIHSGLLVCLLHSSTVHERCVLGCHPVICLLFTPACRKCWVADGLPGSARSLCRLVCRSLLWRASSWRSMKGCSGISSLCFHAAGAVLSPEPRRAQGRAALICGDCGLQRTRASDRGAHNHPGRAVVGNVKAPVTEGAMGCC